MQMMHAVSPPRHVHPLTTNANRATARAVSDDDDDTVVAAYCILAQDRAIQPPQLQELPPAVDSATRHPALANHVDKVRALDRRCPRSTPLTSYYTKQGRTDRCDKHAATLTPLTASFEHAASAVASHNHEYLSHNRLVGPTRELEEEGKNKIRE